MATWVARRSSDGGAGDLPVLLGPSLAVGCSAPNLATFPIPDVEHACGIAAAG